MWCVIGQALSRERRERQREKEERQRLQEQLMERDQSIEKLQCQVTSLQQVIVARHVAQPSRSTWLIRRAPRDSAVATHVTQPSRSMWLIPRAPRGSVVARHVAVVARHVAQSLHATWLSQC